MGKNSYLRILSQYWLLTKSSALLRQEIDAENASKYTKIGTLSVTEDGFTMSDDDLSQKVDEKGGKYYVITSKEGKEEHKTINADIYK
ncbi:YdgH/BhsA/McbA family protein [Enterobacter cloacae]|uniref:DUF1471 domain-containing protein n=1 Tax=Enterobacter cloacae TaxID=550 RepID=UPI002A824E2E|nr:DUF1471 domain-containing protein [Enterobacter cloacae]